MAPWRLERSLAEQAGITPWECRDTFPVGTRDAAAWEEFWGSPAIPLMEVWFGFLFQPYLNPAPLSLLFGHSLRMPSKGRRSCPSTGVGIGNKFHVLVLEGASATFREGRAGGDPSPPCPSPSGACPSWGSLSWAGCPRASGASVGTRPLQSPGWWCPNPSQVLVPCGW